MDSLLTNEATGDQGPARRIHQGQKITAMTIFKQPLGQSPPHGLGEIFAGDRLVQHLFYAEIGGFPVG